MNYRQRQYPDKTEFDFQDQRLEYSVSDTFNKKRFSIKYSQIPDLEENTYYHESSNKLRLYTGVCVCTLGLIQAILRDILVPTDLMKVQYYLNFLYMWVGLLLLMTAYWPKMRYTIIDTAMGKIFLLKSNNHDEIFHELQTRRNNAIVSELWEVDSNSDKNSEIEKYKWLHSNKFISDEQLKERIMAVDAAFLDSGTENVAGLH